MFVAVAVGGIGGATVILSLASPPATERSSRVMILETAAVSPAPEVQPRLASATPAAMSTATMARTDGNAAAPVETPHTFSVPAKPEAQNHKGRVAYRGKHRYRNFARYFAPRFSASW
jgi:hypothetical protein